MTTGQQQRNATVSQPSDRQIRIERIFDAPETDRLQRFLSQVL